MSSLKQLICNAYLAVLFVVYPLFQHDHYYNMGENKYYFYLWSTIIFLVLLVIAIVTDPDTYKKSGYKNSSKKKNKNVKSKKAVTQTTSEKMTFKERLIQIKDKFMDWFGPKSIVEKFVWAYLVCAIISFIFGIDHYTGFWGVDGWHMGLLIQCLMIACFFAFAKVWEPCWWPVWCSMFGSAIVMILGIVMRFGIDPLGNYEGLDKRYIVSFISTIGQTSWYSSYICTVLPVGVAMFFISEKKVVRVFSTVYTILASLALGIADSDSVILGIAGLLMVLFWIAFIDEKYMIRFWTITTILVGAFVTMDRIKTKLWDYYTGYFDWSELTSVKSSDSRIYTMAFLFCLVVLSILIILSNIDVLKKVYSHKGVLVKIRCFIYLMVVVGLITIVSYITMNTLGVFGITKDMIPDYGSIWFFNDAWGNSRGTSWKACWDVFSDYNIGRKLVGIGPDSLAVVTQYVDRYREMIASRFGDEQVLTCAHNEFYNHLVVYGILGGVAYLGIFIAGIKAYIKSFANRPEIIIGAVCIASYMGHNLFCYQTVICTPFIFVIIGICDSLLNEEKSI